MIRTSAPMIRSPPVRRRGLKPAVVSLILSRRLSPPVRRRGLKLRCSASKAGIRLSPPVRRRGLKPSCGASPSREAPSPPVRRRGLKLRTRHTAQVAVHVASRAEAWIETWYINAWKPSGTASPPVRRRGLKQGFCLGSHRGGRSPPVRRRGLKLALQDLQAHAVDVASRAEAWIETYT